MPDEMRAVHFALDRTAADDLADEWRGSGSPASRSSSSTAPTVGSRAPRSSIVARELADGDTEVSVLIPHRVYKRFWHRLLHDRTADEIARRRRPAAARQRHDGAVPYG